MRPEMCLGSGDDVVYMAKTVITDTIMGKCECVLKETFTFSSSM